MNVNCKPLVKFRVLEKFVMNWIDPLEPLRVGEIVMLPDTKPTRRLEAVEYLREISDKVEAKSNADNGETKTCAV